MNNILNYWYELEYFTPCWPVDFKKDINLHKSKLPWPPIEQNPYQRTSFDLYLGKAESEKLIKWMIEELNLPFEEKIEPNNVFSCLCAIKVDNDGKYVPTSFAVASFIWAICKFVKYGFDHNLDSQEVADFQATINKSLLEGDENEPVFVTQDVLDNLYKTVCEKICIDSKQMVYTKWAKMRIQKGWKKSKQGEEYEFPPMETTTELIPSFYLNDIEKVSKHPTERIKQYVQAMDSSAARNERIQIDTDVEQMQNWLQARRYPLGIWPSKYNPCLMQQIGINLAISNEQSIFSVNGPPGTGKTTLLKEIIVSNIVQRAVEMSKFDVLDDAFTAEKFTSPPDQFNQSYYIPDPSLTQYGIIVASNNNAAVENISVELPKRIKEDRTGHFSDIKITDADDYFAGIATDLLQEPAWGLISAKLGKKKNIENLIHSLWEKKDTKNLQNYYKDTDNIPTWNIAKEKFNIALKNVLDAQKEIDHAQHLLKEFQEAQIVVLRMQDEYGKSQKNFQYYEDSLSNINNILEQLIKSKTMIQENIKLLVNGLSFIKRIFWKLFKANPVIKEWKQNEVELQNVLIEITRQRSACNKQEQLRDCAKQQEKNALTNLKSAQDVSNAISEKLLPYKVRFARSFPENSFWDNIEKNKESQEISPWTDNEYDKLREELFYQALMLHKAFVLNSNAVKQNLKRLFKMWKNKFTSEDRKRAYASLLNTLLFLIPVISTTFASVESFLGDINAEELGVLVIDESGQATPQSALGAIWRTQKTIIVGDPLQVEPIMTTPKELQMRFAEKHKISPIYRIPEMSVQLIGDQLNRFGGIRMLSEQELWLGCPLVLHRRCLDPMFSISNEIAYNKRMFLKTPSPKSTIRLLLDNSYWFDVKGNVEARGNQNVKEQNEVAIELFTRSFENVTGFPDIYIITPFKKIGEELKRKLLPIIKSIRSNYEEIQIKEWLKDHCGTVHTFQGKEANEVILILGCDTSVGKGAAKWVGQKPNIINVAVSRAKYRLYVVGDYDQWKTIPNVMVACDKLTRTTIQHSKLQ